MHTLYVQILDLKRVFYPGFERPVALTNRNKMSLIINVEAIYEENVYGGGGGQAFFSINFLTLSNLDVTWQDK